MALSESLTKAILSVSVPPLPRFSSATSTRVPGFSPSAEAMPAEVVATPAGAAAEVVATGAGADGAEDVVAADDVVTGAGAAVSEAAVDSFFAHETTTRTDSRRTS